MRQNCYYLHLFLSFPPSFYLSSPSLSVFLPSLFIIHLCLFLSFLNLSSIFPLPFFLSFLSLFCYIFPLPVVLSFSSSRRIYHFLFPSFYLSYPSLYIFPLPLFYLSYPSLLSFLSLSF